MELTMTLTSRFVCAYALFAASSFYSVLSDDLLGERIWSTVSESYRYRSYQRSITCTASSAPVKPETIQDVQSIVKFALKANRTVKVIGNLHSVTDIFCTDDLVINMTHISHFSYDTRTRRATVGAGMTFGEFVEMLHRHRRAVQSAPSYSSITVGGALATGAHGTSLLHPTTLSDQIFSVKFVDGEGNVRSVAATEEDFKAFRVNLGLLGVIFEVVVDTIREYKMQIWNFPVKDEILWNGTQILDLAKENDHFQFWWFPTNRAVVLSVGKRVRVSEAGTCETHLISEFGKVESNSFSVAIELMQTTRDHMGLFLVQSYAKLSLYKSVPGRTPYFTHADGTTPCLPKATGYSYKMLSNGCKECFWKQGKLSMLEDDSNIAIPIDELFPALHTLREIMESQLTQFPLNGLYFRFLKSSDSLVGMNSGRDSVSIEWISNPRYDQTQPKLYITSYLAIGQALLKEHEGRPHWAKNGLMYFHPDIIRRVHPQIGSFIEAMEKYDPRGVFMNDFGARIRLGKNLMTVTSKMLERCALTEVCMCRSDSDCGNGGPFDYECGRFLDEYRVCKQKPNAVEDIKTALSRKVIETITATVNNEDFVFNALSDYKVFGNMFLRKKTAASP